MTRQEVESAWIEYLRAEQAVRDLVAEHNRQLSPLLQRRAQLETEYALRRRQLHAEQDARGR